MASNRPSWPDVRQLAIPKPHLLSYEGRIAPLPPPCLRPRCVKNRRIRTTTCTLWKESNLSRSLTSSKHLVRLVLVLMLTAAFGIGAASPAMALSAKKRAVIKIIRAEAKKKHLKKADIAALLKICKRESGYRPGARNHSCKGLFQLKTKFGRSKWANAAWNTRKAIRYIKHRYGTARAALRHSNRYGWY
jgi:hypothetical protein